MNKFNNLVLSAVNKTEAMHVEQVSGCNLTEETFECAKCLNVCS